MPDTLSMTEKDIELIRYDDGEFVLVVGTRIVGPVLTNTEAREIRQHLQAGTFDFQKFQHAGVVE